jgi:hypothetical protein
MLSTHDHIDSASWRHWRFCEWALLSVDGTLLSIETTTDVSFRNLRVFRFGGANYLYDDLDDEHGQYAFLRSNGQSPIGITLVFPIIIGL